MLRVAGTGIIAVFVTISTCLADNWPFWRGPSGNGVAPEGRYPLEWSATRNVAWKFPLPGAGGSTPIVWEDRIFLTAPRDGRNVVFCLDRAGRLLWETAVGRERPGKHRKGSGANPSAVTDGRYVFVYFKSGDLAGLDYSGKILWHKNIQQLYGEDTLWWDLGTSPVLTRQHVVLAYIHSGPSYLIAFDKATGREVWNHPRNLDAPEEAAQTYSTPMVAEHDGKQIIVVLGADHVTGHDAQTGDELWRVGGLNPEGNGFFRSIASPVVGEGIVVAPYARGATLTAIRLGGRGDVTNTHVLWSRDDGTSSDVSTPAIDGQQVYVCRDRGEGRGQIVCLNIQTGETVWSLRLERARDEFSSSPIVVGDRIYVIREDGRTFVLSPGDNPQVLARNDLHEFVVATPVFVDNQILIRTAENLYCIAEADGAR